MIRPFKDWGHYVDDAEMGGQRHGDREIFHFAEADT
jgi:hypothetical protein